MQLDPNHSAQQIAEAILAEATASTKLDDEANGLSLLLSGPPKLRDVKKYRTIFWKVEAGTTDPLLKFRAMVEVLRGARRTPGQKLEPILKKLLSLETKIDHTGTIDTDTADLLSTTCYNVGMVFMGLRRYLDAAMAQGRSAVWALLAGNMLKAMTADFIVAWCVASHCLMTQQGVKQSLLILRQRRVQINAYCASTSQEIPRWIRENAGLHIWTLHVWAGANYLEEVADEDNALSMGEALPHWAACVQMKRLIQEENYVKAMETAEAALIALDKVESGSGLSNARLTLMLLQAAGYYYLSQVTEARIVLGWVVKWKGTDGGGAMGAAQQELATMSIDEMP